MPALNQRKAVKTYVNLCSAHSWPRYEILVGFKNWPFYSRWKTFQYQFDSRLDGPQSPSVYCLETRESGTLRIYPPFRQSGFIVFEISVTRNHQLLLRWMSSKENVAETSHVTYFDIVVTVASVRRFSLYIKFWVILVIWGTTVTCKTIAIWQGL